MNQLLPGIQKILRRVTLVVLPPLLVLITLVILATQFAELSTRNEILSLSSFIVIVSFSALAFNWCRVSSEFTSAETLKAIYQTGIDLFLASLLALTASFFAWLQTTPTFISPGFYGALFAIHFALLFLALLIFLLAILALLKVVRAGHATSAQG